MQTIDLAISLVNTAMPTAPGYELLGDLSALRQFLKEAGWSTTSLRADDLAEVHALRHDLRALFEAASEPHDSALQFASALKPLLTPIRAHPKAALTDERLVLEWHPPSSATTVERLRTELTLAVAHTAETLGVQRLKLCGDSSNGADFSCRAAFIDTSPKGVRVYCREQCASRSRVTAFRERARRGSA